MKHVHKFICPAAALALLGGCATTKFAPPVVLTEHRLTETDKCGMAPATAIKPNSVEGAADLVNNYIYAYRCHTGTLSGGRAWFQVPAYLGIAATTAAVAFGAGPTVALAGGSFATVSSSGNSYYAPEQKALIVNKALNALICIQNESVGVPAYAQPEKTTAPPNGDIVATGSDKATVKIDWDQQYFTMVKAALLSVETVVRERLVSAGTYNPSGTVAEIEALQKKRDEATKKAEDNKKALETGETPKAKTDAPITPGTQVAGAPEPSGDTELDASGKMKKNSTSAQSAKTAADDAEAKADTRKKAEQRKSELALDEMQPKLALCVERAKI